MSKKSFFQRLKGSISMSDTHQDDDVYNTPEDFRELDELLHDDSSEESLDDIYEEDEELDGELTVDVYRDGDALIIKAMTSGVKKDDLDITITREQVEIRGIRSSEDSVDDDMYYHQELYWGTFSRLIQLPEEIDVDQAKAKEEHGLLTIILPLVDKDREAKLNVE